MKNWNTDPTKFSSEEEKRLWELAQMINYGSDGEKLSRRELISLWPKLKPYLDPERA